MSLIVAGVSLAAEYSFAYSQVPSNFYCSALRVYSTDGAVSYSLPKNAKITTQEFLNGTQYASMSSSLSGKSSHSFPVVSSRFASAQSFPYVYTVNYTVKVDNSTISQSSLSVKCLDANTGIVINNSVSFASTADDTVVATAPDARFNWGVGDSNIAILYPDGNSVDLYLYANGQYIPNFVTADDLAAFADNAPAENTLIAQAGAVSVYVLTTGEISFIIGPDTEGKQYALIMTDLSGSNSYGYEL